MALKNMKSYQIQKSMKKLKIQELLYMKNKEYYTITKMIEYINKTLKYTEKCDFKSFCANEEKVDAIMFALSKIDELVKNIS